MSEYKKTSEHVHVFDEFYWFEVFFILSQSKEFSLSKPCLKSECVPNQCLTSIAKWMFSKKHGDTLSIFFYFKKRSLSIAAII